ncbi:MAG: LamG domain-containing protein, partial [Candidatus Anstonellales archaeon]
MVWYAEDQDNPTLECSLWVKNPGSTYQAVWNGTVDSGVRQTFNHTIPSNGTYNWFANCSDNETQVNSSIWSFIFYNLSSAPPVVNLVAPPNKTKFNASQVPYSLNLTWNATDENDTQLNCTVFVQLPSANDFMEIWSGTVPNGTNMNTSFDAPLLGVYNWYAACNDSTNVTSYSDVWWFNVSVNDTTPPVVQLINPPNNTNYSITEPTNVTLRWNVTDNESPTLFCSLEMQRPSVYSFMSIWSGAVDNGTVQNNTYLLNDIGTHRWRAWCRDFAGHIGVSQTWQFNVSSPLYVYLHRPPNGYFFSAYSVPYRVNLSWYFISNSSTTALCNVSVKYPSAGSYVLLETNINATNNTITKISRFMPEFGQYLWYVTCADGTYLATSVVWDFVIGLRNTTDNPPLPVLLLPVDGFIYLTDLLPLNINLSYVAYDDISQNLTCNLSVRPPNSQYYTLLFNNRTLVNGLVYQSSYWAYEYGTYQWFLTCMDNASQTNSSFVWSFVVRPENITGPPIVQLRSPPNGDSTIKTPPFSETLQWNVTDVESATLNCMVFMKNPIDLTFYNITGNLSTPRNSNRNTAYTGWWKGTYQWFVRCYDGDGNVGYSPIWYFIRLGGDPPTVRLVSPPDYTVTYSTRLNLTWNVSDDDSFVYCNLSIDGVIVNGIRVSLGFGGGNKTITNETGVLSEGNHTWFVNCTDGTYGSRSETWNFQIDTHPPSVTLQAPPNNSVFTTDTHNLTWYVEDNYDSVLDCDLYIDGMLNASYLASYNGTNTTLERGPLSDGLHNWSVKCRDDANNTGNSSVWYFYIYAGGPLVQLMAPPNNTTFTVSNLPFNLNLTWNATDIISENLTCYVEAKHSSDPTFTIIWIGNITNGSTVNTSFVAAQKGDYLWYVLCNNSLNVTGASDTWAFNINHDATPPEVHLITPPNGSRFNSTDERNLTWNVTDNESNQLNCTVYLDGNPISNIIVGNSTTNTSSGILSAGHHIWNVSCFDEVNHTGYSENWEFWVDTAPPLVILLAPPNASVFTSTDAINLTFNTSDDQSAEMNCTVYLDGSPLGTTMAQNNTLTNMSTGALTSGNHTWNVSCRDDANNTGYSSTWMFRVSMAPIVNLMAPPNSSLYLNTSPINLTWNVSDVDTGALNCTVYLDSTPINNSLVANSTPINTTTPSLTSGRHDWNVSCNDSDNIAYSATWFFFVNLSPTIESVILNSTSVWNSTSGNLTAYPQNVADPENDRVDLIFDWKENGKSIAFVNVNFNVNNSAGTGISRDFSDYGNNITAVNGALWNATGGPNNTGAYMLDGIDDHLTIPGATMPSVWSNGLTMCGWFYFKPGATLTNRRFFDFSNGNPTGAPSNNIILQINSSTDELLYRVYIGTTPYNLTTTTANIATGVWTHLCAVHFKNGTASIYKDGVQVASGPMPLPQDIPRSYYYIGRSHNGTAHINGSIDDIIVMNRSSSPQEIYNIYANNTDELHSGMLISGYNYTVCVTPDDMLHYGNTVCSNNITTYDLVRVFLISPPNNTVFNETNNVTLVFNASSLNKENMSCTLYLNSTPIYNNTTVISDELTSVPLINLPYNNYGWNVTCNISNEIGYSETWIFHIVPSGPPLVTNIDIKTSLELNTTQENITAIVAYQYLIGAEPTEIYDWKQSGVSMAVLNLPFEANDGNENSFTDNYGRDKSLKLNILTPATLKWSRYGGYNGSGAYYFAGGTNVSFRPINASLNNLPKGNDNFTIMFWFNPTRNSTSSSNIIYRINGTGANNYSQVVLEGLDYSTIRFYYMVEGAAGTSSVAISNPLPRLNTWKHVAITYDGNAIRIYLNGVYVNGVVPGRRLAMPSNWFTLGSYPNAYSMNGSLDNFEIYDRWLSQEEIIGRASGNYSFIHLRDSRVYGEYSFCLFLNNHFNISSQNCSQTLQIKNNTPYIKVLSINSSTGQNLTLDNIEAYVNTSGGNRETLRNHTELIYDWKEDGVSMATIILPFEGEDGEEPVLVSNYGRNKSVKGVPSALYSSPGDFPPTWYFTQGYNNSGVYYFNSSRSQLIEFNNSSVAFPSGDQSFTIEFRVKITDFSTGIQYIYLQQGIGANNKSFITVSNNNICFYFALPTGFNDGLCHSTSQSINRWYHIAVSYDGVALRLYKDGVLLSGKIPPMQLSQPNTYVMIGRAIGGGYFNGYIDNFVVYDRWLSTEAIRDHYLNKTAELHHTTTKTGKNYSVCVYANDGFETNVSCSQPIEILSNKPYIEASINSSFGTNTTQENITAYVNTSGGNAGLDRNHTEIIYDWQENGQSMAILNLPFEGNDGSELQFTKNYGKNKSLLVRPYAIESYTGDYPPAWNFTTGYNGSGAYTFNESIVNFLFISNDSAWQLPSGNQNFTIEMMVYPFTNTSDTIYTQYSDVGTGNVTKLTIAPGSNPTIKFDYMTQSVSRQASWSAPGLVSHKWHHIAVTYDGITIRAFLNGMFIGAVVPGVPLATPNKYAKIGSDEGFLSFTGILDNVRVYDRWFSPEQIALFASNQTNVISFRDTHVGSNY